MASPEGSKHGGGGVLNSKVAVVDGTLDGWMEQLNEFINSTIKPPREVHLKSENICYVVSNKFEYWPIGNGRTKEYFDVDEQNIRDTFEKLNFEVKIKSNLSKENMKTFITDLGKKDFSNDQCLVMIILSHGEDEGRMLCNDNETLPMSWIVQQLQDIKSLHGKPKMLFANFCRGEKLMEKIKVDDDAQAAAAVIEKAKKADTLVYYSTMEGNVAFASADIGSYFVMAFCKIMREFFLETRPPREGPPKYHLNDVIVRVNDFVSTFIRKRQPDWVQMSEACTSLTQNVYFYPKE